uniref:Probable oligoribonuclease n=2 Tax=Trichogramma TaxID=7490 RepID=A0ABD2WZS9_9HYME
MSIIRTTNRCFKKFERYSRSVYYSINANKKQTVKEMAENQHRSRIVWIDMEMTGLDVETDRILEVACLITDEHLNIVSDEFCKILYQPDSLLNNMDEWCTKTHRQTGLIELSRKSKEDEKSVSDSLLHFMMKYIPKGKCPMAGNSVYMDRLFLRKYMSSANDYMHYRIIDVSSIKEVVRRWKPEIYNSAPSKDLCHRALDDIKESIQELDFYRKNVFNANI